MRRAFVTLHIGPGTFAPLRSDVVEQHSMEAEWYVIPPETARGDRACEAHRRPHHRGRHQQRAHARIACGDGRYRGASPGSSFIPGFRFKLVDAMITNFHMPRTTVLALVMALAGREQDPRRLSRGDSSSLPLPQLRRRDADSMMPRLSMTSAFTSRSDARGDARRQARHGARRNRDPMLHAGRHAGCGEGDGAR